EAGHAPTAVHVPLAQVRAEDLPAGGTVYCICRSGGRSGKAAEALLGAGLRAVNVAGGMDAWKAAELPVVRDDGSPGTVI
ncbi:MAG: rhodanese-like domain-containing protein, partial [Acidimicrobiia bacterium]